MNTVFVFTKPRSSIAIIWLYGDTEDSSAFGIPQLLLNIPVDPLK